MGRRIGLLVNQDAGWRLPDIDRLAALLGRDGDTVYPQTLASAGGFEAQARRYVDAGFDVLATAGGDGTLNAVARALVGSDCALGILPCGTRNHLARDLGVPLGLEGAAAVIRHGRRARIDVGQAGDRLFLNNLSLGLYPAFAQERRAFRTRDRRHPFATAAAAWHGFRDWPCVTLDVHTRDHTWHWHTPLLLVANNPYRLRGPGWTRRAHLDSGVLCIYAMPEMPRQGIFALGLATLTGRAEQAGLLSHCGASFLLSGDDPTLMAALDGEVQPLSLPCELSSKPGALWVIRPD